jgi:ribosomal-protein-alanine N-acetyltransferase
MTHLGTKLLETERLILRKFEKTDAEAMFRNWASDPEVTKFLMWKPHASIEVSQTVIDEWVTAYAKDDYYQWAIVPRDLGEPIGSIAVVKVDDETKMVHIGYCIGTRWWSKGYTSEALTRLVKFFFEEVGVNRVESRHDPRNPNSGAVMMKAGLKFERTLTQADWNNQGICDVSYYAILADGYNKG